MHERDGDEAEAKPRERGPFRKEAKPAAKWAVAEDCDLGDSIGFTAGRPRVRSGTLICSAPSVLGVVAFFLTGTPFVRFSLDGGETAPIAVEPGQAIKLLKSYR